MNKKESARAILCSLNKQLRTSMELVSRNGYYAIDNRLANGGFDTLASGFTLNEAIIYIKGIQAATWMLNA